MSTHIHRRMQVTMTWRSVKGDHRSPANTMVTMTMNLNCHDDLVISERGSQVTICNNNHRCWQHDHHDGESELSWWPYDQCMGITSHQLQQSSSLFAGTMVIMTVDQNCHDDLMISVWGSPVTSYNSHHHCSLHCGHHDGESELSWPYQCMGITSHQLQQSSSLFAGTMVIMTVNQNCHDDLMISVWGSPVTSYNSHHHCSLHYGHHDGESELSWWPYDQCMGLLGRKHWSPTTTVISFHWHHGHHDELILPSAAVVRWHRLHQDEVIFEPPGDRRGCCWRWRWLRV